MTKQEYMSYALLTGLMAWTPSGEYFQELDISNFENIKKSSKKLVLHPFFDLIKPISQANYNNGKPFVPALELIKLEEKYNKWKDIAPTIPYDVAIINKSFGKVLKVSKLGSWVIILSLNEIERAKYYIVSQLIKWHFNLMDEGEEFIDVNSLDINPYK